MFSGAKSKLQQWRIKKTPAKKMEDSQKEYRKQVETITENFKNLQVGIRSIIGQLNQQVDFLKEIDEDTTVAQDKINSLTHISDNVDKGLQDAEEFTSFIQCVDKLTTFIEKANLEIEDFKRHASALFTANNVLRIEIQTFEDHHERAEMKAVELGVQIEHLKFISSLPSELSLPLFEEENGDQDEMRRGEENYAINPTVAIPFLEEDDYDADEGAYILSVLDTMDFRGNTRLKILFDLIKKYIKNDDYEVAIPLLKTSLEDLMSNYDPNEKIVLTMMDVLVIVFNATQHFSDAIKIHEQILQIRKEKIPDDKAGLAKTFSSLAALYGKIGKIKTARNYSRQALELKNKMYGEHNLETAKELHNVGVLYSYDRKYLKAISCLSEAIQLMRACSKPSVYCLALALANIASVHIENNDLIEAKRHFRSTLKYLHVQLGKKLEGKGISVSEILSDKNKIDTMPEITNRKEIKRLINLKLDVIERSQLVSHIVLDEDITKVGQDVNSNED